MAVNRESETKNRIRIAFTYYKMTAFVERDLSILRKHFEVIPIQFKGFGDFFSLVRGVMQCDLTFSWFAWDHAAIAVFLAKLFNKKSIVIVGGMDAAYVPEINYGSFMTPKGSLVAKYVYKNADKILVVDLSLKNDVIKNAKVSGENIDYLPTGYDINYWKPGKRKENVILTVGAVSHIIVRRKGFETFVKAARYLPNTKFVLVGKHIDNSIEQLESISTSNVEFTDFVSNEELLSWYQLAKIYCQLSRYEGLPNSLCEAMLCECIPVGTKRCGIPTAIGDTGFYVRYGDPKATAESIKKALNAPDELGKKARKRIEKMFPSKKRENELYKIIADLVK